MNVKYILAGGTIAVEHATITRLGNAFLRGDLLRRKKQIADQFSVLRFNVVDRGDVSLGDHQDVCGSLGIDVTEGQYLLVFINDIGLNFSGHHLAEQTVRHTPSYFIQLSASLLLAVTRYM
jgi:hypothetical protein